MLHKNRNHSDSEADSPQNKGQTKQMVSYVKKVRKKYKKNIRMFPKLNSRICDQMIKLEILFLNLLYLKTAGNQVNGWELNNSLTSRLVNMGDSVLEENII